MTTTTCPSCGADTPDGARFCPSCGHVLAGAGTGDERRVVTVVFGDLVGFTALSETLDPEGTALRKAGVEPRKLDTLAGWRDSRFFDAREGAALAWAEQLTTLPSGAPADATYEALKDHFDESGIAELTMAVATINAWNRLGVGMQPILP